MKFIMYLYMTLSLLLVAAARGESKHRGGNSTSSHVPYTKPEPRYPLTVHLIPHSHDDIGWQKTLDQYFDGSRKDLRWEGVQWELTTVIDALTENPKRRFSEVEMKFFSMWYDIQDEKMQAKVKRLLANGQLEILNAGWSMHDEACPTYTDMIENMMKG